MDLTKGGAHGFRSAVCHERGSGRASAEIFPGIGRDERQYAKQQYDSTETTVEPQLDAPFGALRGKTFVNGRVDRAVGPVMEQMCQ